MPRVLIVDDEAAIVRVLKEGLEIHGFTIDCAFNGAEAVERVKENPPDAIVMDLSMPVMDGIKATQEIRRLTQGATIPILILTARGEDWDEEAGLKAGANLFVTKPVSLRQLAKELHRLIEAQQS
ncbi:MAG: response regulator [Armatimonadetes bacterium]|nr:response regulator [Armatimonadota bacterium]MDW8121836.1 response regulator [Armatimonadota bacterium]